MTDAVAVIETFLGGVLVAVAAAILVVVFAPERWKEPVSSAVRRLSKWIKNPKLEVTAAKRLTLVGETSQSAVRLKAADGLRDASLWKEVGNPLSFEFNLVQADTKFAVRFAELHDSSPDGLGAREWQLTYEASSSYNDLGETFSDLNAVDLRVRAALQRKLSFVEAPFSLGIRMEGHFPLAGFFRDVQPIILGGRTHDKQIQFDYAPGALTVYAPLDSKTIKWVKTALTSL